MGSRRPRGIALIVVLWSLAILSVALVGFIMTVRTETNIAGNHADGVRAQFTARAGVERALLALRDEADLTTVSLNDEWTQIDSDTDEVDLDDAAYQVAILDESGRINLNTADQTALETITGDPAVAASIIDWRDSDDFPGPDGAEADYYASVTPPYQPRNAAFQTLTELLLVNGVTPEMFYGVDSEGQVRTPDPFAILTAPTDTATGPQTSTSANTAPGLIDLLTIISHEYNVDSQGRQRVNLNTADDNTLRSRLGEVLTTQEIDAILDYRNPPSNQGGGGQGGGDQGGGGKGGPPAPGGQGGGNMPGGRQGPTINVPGATPSPGTGGQGGQGGQPSTQSGGGQSGTNQRFGSVADLLKVPKLPREKVAQIIDLVTVTDDLELPPHININTAPQEVLAVLPQVTESAVQEIIGFRESEDGPFRSAGQLLDLPSITDQTFQALVDIVTVRSWAFRIVSEGSIPQRRIRRRVECYVRLESSGGAGGNAGASAGAGGGSPGGAGAAASAPPTPQSSVTRQAAPAPPTTTGAGAGQPAGEPAGNEGGLNLSVNIVYWKE